MNAQTKAYVFPVPARVSEIDTIKRSILEGGCLLVCSSEPPEAFHKCVSESDVLVILVCPETSGSSLLEQAVDLANKLGKRIVGVWSADAEDVVPQSLHRHGDALVRLSAEELANAVCGEDSVWVTPTGESRTKPPTPRHKG